MRSGEDHDDDHHQGGLLLGGARLPRCIVGTGLTPQGDARSVPPRPRVYETNKRQAASCRNERKKREKSKNVEFVLLFTCKMSPCPFEMNEIESSKEIIAMPFILIIYIVFISLFPFRE